MKNHEEFKALVYEKYRKEQLSRKRYRKQLFRCGAAFAACLALFLVAIPFRKVQDAENSKGLTDSLKGGQPSQQVYGQPSESPFCSPENFRKPAPDEEIYDCVKIYDTENGETKCYRASLPEAQEIISILRSGSALMDQASGSIANLKISLIPSNQELSRYYCYYDSSKNLIISDSVNTQLSPESLLRLNVLLEKLNSTAKESESQNQ